MGRLGRIWDDSMTSESVGEEEVVDASVGSAGWGVLVVVAWKSEVLGLGEKRSGEVGEEGVVGWGVLVVVGRKLDVLGLESKRSGEVGENVRMVDVCGDAGAARGRGLGTGELAISMISYPCGDLGWGIGES